MSLQWHAIKTFWRSLNITVSFHPFLLTQLDPDCVKLIYNAKFLKKIGLGRASLVSLC